MLVVYFLPLLSLSVVPYGRFRIPSSAPEAGNLEVVGSANITSHDVDAANITTAHVDAANITTVPVDAANITTSADSANITTSADSANITSSDENSANITSPHSVSYTKPGSGGLQRYPLPVQRYPLPVNLPKKPTAVCRVRYSYHPEKADWEGARQICEMEGGQLAVITDERAQGRIASK